MMAPDGFVNLMVLQFLITLIIIITNKLSIRKLTCKLHFSVDLSLMGFAYQVPNIINFPNNFPYFLDGSWCIENAVPNSDI